MFESLHLDVQSEEYSKLQLPGKFAKFSVDQGGLKSPILVDNIYG